MDSQSSLSPTSSQQVPVHISMTEPSSLYRGETSSKSFNVLITGAGSPGAVGIIQYLKRFYGVIGVDMDMNATGRKFCDNFYIVPPAKNKEFIPALLKICLEEKVRIVFPKVTAELLKLAEAKKQFQEIGTTILISEKSVILTANNKYLLYKKMEKCGMLVPKFFLAEHGFCSKPVVGSGGDNFKIYEGKKVLVMEYLSGDEYSVDILADYGEALTVVPRVREKVKAGVSVEGTVVIDKEIIELSKKIVKILKLHGIVGLQFRRDKNFKPVLLECNPRIQGTIMLSEASGANLFQNAVNLALGNEIIAPEIRDGTKMFRYWKESYE